MKKFKRGAVALILLSTLAAHAGQEGGGGDAVILPNGDVVLADVFLDRNQPQPNNMPKRISINPKLLLQVKLYNEFLKQVLTNSNFLKNSAEIMNLFTELGTRNSKLVFYSVKNQEELNTFCASGGKKAYKLPDGSAVTQVACTSGDEIFLIESIFSRMNLLQQSLLLMHERMTTLKDQYGGKNYGAIAGVTAGLGEMLKQAYEQQKGNLKTLTAEEQLRIRHFYEAMIELIYRSAEIPVESMNWDIHQNGGGFLYRGAEVDESAFVGVTSTVGPKAVIMQDVAINNSIIFFDGTVEEGTKVSDSKLYGLNLRIGRNSRITSSYLDGRNFHVGDNFTMKDSKIELHNTKTLQLNERQTLVKGEITNKTLIFLPLGTRLNIPKLTFGTVKSTCQDSLREYKQGESECHSYKTGSYSIPKSSFEDLGYSSGGVSMLFDQKVDTEARNGVSALFYSSRPYRVEVLRSFKLDVAFTEVAEDQNSGIYTIQDGNIYPAGQTNLRWIYVSVSYPARQLIVNELLKAAKASNLEAYESGSNVYFVLPVKK